MTPLTITLLDQPAEPPDWIGVDFDGTLALYDEYRGPDHTGAPIIPFVETVRSWLEAGEVVKVFTARVADPDPEIVDRARSAIQAWCEEHLGARLDVVCVKDRFMKLLVDDKACQIRENTGELIGDLSVFELASVAGPQLDVAPEVVPA